MLEATAPAHPKADDARREAVPAFEQVYEEHFAFVFRMAKGLGIPSSSVDDVVQDVFVVVHRKLPEFEGRAKVRTWLTRILFNVVREHRRARARSRHDELSEDFHDDRAKSPEGRAAEREAARILLDMLDAMEADQREVFVLAEVEQMEMPEIASALGINVNTAYSRLRLARREYEKQLARVRARDDWRKR